MDKVCVCVCVTLAMNVLPEVEVQGCVCPLIDRRQERLRRWRS